MSELRFSSDHEWVRVEGDIAVVGITDYAQEQLGDVVFVELPALGASLAKADQAAVVESVKAASEIYAPIGGEVTAVNEALADAPEAVNADPLGGGWFFKLRLADAGELDALMDEDAYKAFVEGLD
ncbi:MAG: glycine cleavage system protein GcvH [Proteobacteria bacterium]|nr:glycine cleavage system protein GcvH [Pseudomonadota bacterium]